MDNTLKRQLISGFVDALSEQGIDELFEKLGGVMVDDLIREGEAEQLQEEDCFGEEICEDCDCELQEEEEVQLVKLEAVMGFNVKREDEEEVRQILKEVFEVIHDLYVQS